MTLDLVGEAGASATTAATWLFGERYRLEGLLVVGGGAGEVWRARDTVTGDPVAVKRIRTLSTAEIAAVRREVAALRWLRLPGVVQLRDEGVADRDYFVVMDLVEGRPFLEPGPHPLSWEEIRAPVLDLLEVLDAVHLAGVVHLDLKPANVFLGPEGRPIVLDFGLAAGVAIASGQHRARGATIRYAAPEQLSGRACDARTDLYALGVMLYEALAGVSPHGAGGWEDVATRRLAGDAPPLERLAPDVPPEVCATVTALLAPEPSERPRTAHGVIARLGGRVELEPAGLPPSDALGAEDLATLFTGPDAFLHLPEDAAAILWARTGGKRARVVEELGAWLRTGLARREHARIRVDRNAIERLRGGLQLGTPGDDAEPPGAPAAERALRRLLVARAPGEEIVRAALVAAETMTHEGRVAAAIGALDLAIAVARQAGDCAGERQLLEEKVVAVLALESAPALDHLLPELTRAIDGGLPLEPVRQLIAARLLTLEGQPGRALKLIEALPSFEHEMLEIWREAGRANALRRVAIERAEEALAACEAWAGAGTAERAARLAGWWGNLRYQQSRFDEAAELHLAKARVSGGVAEISALCNAAYALIEARSFATAAVVAEQVRVRAREVRHAVFEARGVLAVRTIRWRSGGPIAPREELVAAAAALGVPWIEGGFALLEGAVAWRTGDAPLAARLARRSAEAFARAGASGARLLARTLGYATRAEPPLKEERRTLLDEALTCPLPCLALQALGMIRLRDGALTTATADAARVLAASRPDHRWSDRLELLSYAEALGTSRLLPVPPGDHP